ncbi:uncharacterized protein LOC105209493 [Zeugodacus cucurbitae]|uniref:Glutamate-1-semialdehyde 2,1-aminomutase n=1 Tax=Zeugodacus cucurbitae TaxID=28588 RepID=A0A0A1WHB2_ZEUCU|nr:uncharacterized protein LOC105209493 [Zeugodacus cucurbitae]
MPRTTRLLLLLLSACVLSVLQQRVTVNADTKVLNILSLNQPGNSRYEVISLENAGTADEELVIKGNRTVELGPPNSLGLIYMVVTEYTADNNGYRVHSRIEAVPLLETRLSSSLLMSAAG